MRLGAGIVAAGLVGGLMVAGISGAAGPPAASGSPDSSASDSAGAKARSAAGGRSGAGVVVPPANAVFDYQIGGAYPPGPAVGIVDRDHGDPAAPGKYGVCYVNGFQTQPGALASWPAVAVLRDGRGNLVEDPEWPGEFLLDTRTATSRATIRSVVAGWIRGCAGRGFRAVEIDNLDSYNRSPLLSEDANLALATQFVADAHAAGLAAAQKNSVELAGAGRSRVGFDFAVAEECQVYDECDGYTDTYGDQVYELEYVDAGGPANFRAACAARGAHISITYRDRDVVPPSDPAYTFHSC